MVLWLHWQDFKYFFLFFCIFSYYWLLLNSHHIIQMLIDPIGLKRTFGGSQMKQMKFSEKSLCFEWLRHFLLAFSYWFFGFCVFVVAIIVIRLIVMLYWLTMQNKYSFPPIGAFRRVFIDFRWKLLNLKTVKFLKIIFRIFFNH